MVFALETFWPSTDGWSAARIEEEIVVTETGHEVITRFPADSVDGRGRALLHRTGPLATTREHESAPNAEVMAMVQAVTASAKTETIRP